jgi:hypothetical protein
MRLPNDRQPEPPGGRAAERLREFLAEHLPQGSSPTVTETDSDSKPDSPDPPEDPDQKH